MPSAARFALAAALLLMRQPVSAQKLDLRTTPERTSFEETSKYDDVMTFLRAVDRASPLIRLDSMGKTFEGRIMPLVVVGTGLNNTTPAAVRGSNKLRVYLQGNIHAGEVEGKEVLQMLLREIAEGQHRPWLDSLVLLVNPIYNADGNERFSLTNRGTQHGPLKGMGQRPNAQGFDLNRDHMRTESPEAKAVVKMMVDYDPFVAVDLHTTNGSYHAYYLTYAPPLHPNTDRNIISLLRERWLPTMTSNIKTKYGWDYYYYGNLGGRGGGTPGWYTFEHVPRFNNNYVGIRNRIAILSEAYSYATFEDRIKATKYFVDEILEYAYRHASELKRIVDQADRASIVGQTMATRARIDPNGKPATILIGDTIRETNPYSGASMVRRKDVSKPTQMMEFGLFSASDSTVVPRAYFVPPLWTARVAPQLAQHGVRTRTMMRDTVVDAEQFRIDSTTVSPRVFQGHMERTIFGAYEAASVTMPRGTLVIDMTQPLARLAFLLLEPRSDDGLVDWNFLDPDIAKERHYPIVRALR
ncbi:MAG: M14 family metallopeptidase [Gemmatimonadota bacterium]